MKAVVMSSEKGRAVILTGSGEFREIKGNYETGYEFEYKEPVIGMKGKHVIKAALAACLVLVITAGAYNFEVQSAYATVSLGEGIAVEYKLDKEGTVVEVKATDVTGEALADELKSIGVKGKNVEDAIKDAKKVIDEKNQKAAVSEDTAEKPMILRPEVKSKDADQENKIRERVEEAGKSMGPAPEEAAESEEKFTDNRGPEPMEGPTPDSQKESDQGIIPQGENAPPNQGEPGGQMNEKPEG